MAHGEVVSPGDFFSYEVVETRKGCGGSLVARQTLETEVQDSNLTSPTMILGRSVQVHWHCVKRQNAGWIRATFPLCGKINFLFRNWT